MTKRKSAVAGMFYPNSSEELLKYFTHFELILKDVTIKNELNPRAIISPHAGYIYSGFTANAAFNQVKNKNPKRVIVIGPSHKVYINGASIGLYDEYETPFGNINVDIEYSQLLKEKFDFLTFDKYAHAEHSTETQMPFIKHYFKDSNVIEIVYGNLDFKILKKLIEFLLEDEDNFIVISTDLSHFYSLKEANELDNICLNAIKKLDMSLFEKGCEACGIIGVKAIISCAIDKKLKTQIVDYRTSYDASDDSSSVVGYVSVLIGE